MISSEDLRFFSAVAQARSLAAAARTLNVSASAVTQRLSKLEQRLGTRLLNRNGRQMTLTDEGQAMLERAARILLDLDQLEEGFAARNRKVVGRLRILAPFGFGRHYVAPALSAFMDAHPEATAELTLKARLGRQSDDAWDMIIHIGALPDSGLAMQRLAPNRRLACASPGYLERNPPIEKPDDLRRHACLALRENDEDVTLWRFTAADGETAAVRVEPILGTNDGDVLRDWARAGHGVIVRSEWAVADDIRSGRLRPLLTDYALPPADVVALLGPRGQRSARTRLFLQHLRAFLAPVPWRREEIHPSLNP